MISINKSLAFAVVASVLLASALVNAEGQQASTGFTSTARMATNGVIAGISNIGNRIFDGIQTAKDTIISHLPGMRGNVTEKANGKNAEDVVETVQTETEQVATEEPIVESVSEQEQTEAPVSEEPATKEVKPQAQENNENSQ